MRSDREVAQEEGLLAGGEDDTDLTLVSAGVPRSRRTLAAALVVAGVGALLAGALFLAGSPRVAAPSRATPAEMTVLAEAAYKNLGEGNCLDGNGVNVFEKPWSWIGSTSTTSECREKCNEDPDCLGYQQSGTQVGYGGTANCQRYRKLPKQAMQRRRTSGWGKSICYAKESTPSAASSGSSPSAVSSGSSPAATSSASDLVSPPSTLPAGAEEGDAKPFPNIHLATLGYNLYYGDPLPVWPDSATPNPDKVAMDPGLRRPLFVLKYTQGRLSGDRRHTNPDGFHATVDQGCSQIFTTKTVRDQSEYATDQSETVSAYTRAELAVTFPDPGKLSKTMKGVTVGPKGKLFTRVGGTLSYQWRDMQKNNRLVNSQLYKTSAKCVSYVAALSFVAPPETHPEFQKVVDAASSDSDYFTLFDDYGTHMLTTVKFGARYGNNIFVDGSKVEDARKTADGIGLSVFASVGAVAKLGVSYKSVNVGVKKVVQKMVTVPLITPKEKDAGRTFSEKFVANKTTSIVGPPFPAEGGSPAWEVEVEKNPVPIVFDQEPICSHPAIASDVTKYEQCSSSLNAYCERHLKPKGASCAVATKECYSDTGCFQKPDHVCRNSKCVPVPKCSASVYRNTGYGGGEYQLPMVTAKKYPDGLLVDIRNGDFADSISSFKMSDGCMRAELIDDDGNCVLGKSDNLVTHSSRSSLAGDLDNDVCKIKIWAKPAPPERPQVGTAGWIEIEKLRSSTSSGDDAARANDLDTSANWRDQSCTHTNNENQPWWKVGLGETYDVKAVRITNRGDCCWDRFSNADIYVGHTRCARGIRLGAGETREIVCVATGSEVKIQLAGSGILTICEVAIKAEKRARRLASIPEDDIWHTLSASAQKLDLARRAASDEARRQALARAAAARDGDEAPGRHLAEAGSHLKNIGKAMYGYNVNYGSPASAEFAGSDPGFRHRPVWAVSYASGATSTSKRFSEIPRDPQQEQRHFRKYYKMYLGDYTSEGGKKYTDLKSARERCLELWDCTGIVCGRDYVTIRNNEEKVKEDVKCTLRKGSELKESPIDETTFVAPGKSVTGDECSALLYKEGGLSGSSWHYGPGRYSNMGGKAPNDAISSLSVHGVEDCRVTLYQHGSYSGWSATFEPGRYDMQLMASRGAKNDDCSSIIVGVKQKARRLTAAEPANASAPAVAELRRLQSAMKVPDGWKVTTASSVICDTDFQSSEIRSVYKYQHTAVENLNPFGFKLDLGQVTLSLSHESREFRKQNAESKKVMLQSTAECLDYIAEIADLKRNPPPTSTNFQYVAGEVSGEQQWYRLFDLYGTHFPTKVVFGAKFGTSTLMKESSYKTVKKDSSSFSVGAEYTRQIEAQYKGGKAKAFGTVGVNYASKKEETDAAEFASAFTETEEYSLGKRMPVGGAAEWVKLAEGEPMPTRYGLVSICEHPALVPKKSDCGKYAKTYCSSYLGADNDEAMCAMPQAPQCTWDADCLPHHVCSNEVCVEEPPCYVKIFPHGWLNGDPKILPLDKPVYSFEFGDGRFVELWPRTIRSYWVSGGCKEVIFMDEDKCRESYEDNEVVSNRYDNDPRWNNDIKGDLSMDVCKLKLHAKTSWAL